MTKNEALERKAENARELGLDYEPEQKSVAMAEYMALTEKYVALKAAQRIWVGLTRIELIKCGVLPFGMSYELYEAIEAKLKEKNT
tara:strand:+ start:87 stop:344 length:258 start_codon:yes stop_codon:yes gene_type:complete